MTPKEKAKELVLKYWNLPIIMNHIIDGVIHIETNKHLYENDAKQCALIAVDEILKITWADKFLTVEDYWKEVKEEIEKL